MPSSPVITNLDIIREVRGRLSGVETFAKVAKSDKQKPGEPLPDLGQANRQSSESLDE
jgi:hypothetical protein